MYVLNKETTTITTTKINNDNSNLKYRMFGYYGMTFTILFVSQHEIFLDTLNKIHWIHWIDILNNLDTLSKEEILTIP